MTPDDELLAEKLLEEGNASELYELIAPYLEHRDPVALYYWSCISLADWGESDEDFDRRRVELLEEAADKGVARALYRLACCYMFGEAVEQNEPKARDLAQRALEGGYEPAKHLVQQR